MKLGLIKLIKIIEEEKVRKEKLEEDKNKKLYNSVDADQGTSKSKQLRLDYFRTDLRNTRLHQKSRKSLTMLLSLFLMTPSFHSI